MSVNWTRNQSDSGILRKSEFKEKKEELFVFGYTCKLFRDDEKALHIDQGKHLIPWMGDETLKIDRYDARGALHDLSSLEAPPGGFDWRVELSRAEQDVEQLCDEERYRALHTDEDEEEMYREEELKRLHKAGYGQVGFNYNSTPEPPPVTEPTENDEPYEAPAALIALLPGDVVLPVTEKQNAIIDKTAKFIASQGAQMEILLRAKQADNPQFQFLNKDNELHPYYMALIGLVKAGKWPEKEKEVVVEEKPPEPEEYLHPSLGSTIIESAPSIPSIHYRPSADCDYTMLISKIRGDVTLDEPYTPSLAPGELPPPGTQPLHLPERAADIYKPPVMYSKANSVVDQQSSQAHYHPSSYYQYESQPRTPPLSANKDEASDKKAPVAPPGISTGLSLMKNYASDTDSEGSESDEDSDEEKPQPIAEPPEDVKVVIDKMAAYVARNGDEFADIVRSKNDPRFTFLDPTHQYHAFYLRLMKEKRGVPNGAKEKKGKGKKPVAPVSFSIKKLKEPDPVLPKPALPYESSSDEEDKQTDKQTEQTNTNQENSSKTSPVVPTKLPPHTTAISLPPVIVYRVEEKPVPVNNFIEKPVEITTKPVPEKVETKPETPKPEKKEVKEKPELIVARKEKSLSPERIKQPEKVKEDRRRKEKYDYRSKSESREFKVERSSERDKRRHKEVRVKKRRVHSKDELETEVISLEENSNEFIDLTGDHSDSKGDGESENDKAKQIERRRRAAEFLKKVGVDPSAAALPTTSLASAMVDTLESLRKKKAEDEERRRRREKKRHRHERESERSRKKSKRRRYEEDDEGTDYDSSKKKRRKKEKKHSSSRSKKKKRREEDFEEVEDQPLNIDLTTTLKVLRAASPTNELGLDLDDATQQSFASKKSSESENWVENDGVNKRKRKKKEPREYSEGEWSSDSEEDSVTTADGDTE